MLNISLIFVTLVVFQFDISGKSVNSKQLENKPFILVTFFVSQFEILDKFFKFEQLENI